MSETSLAWLQQLPAFPYLPQESMSDTSLSLMEGSSIASTLIKPFSLFSLFRSSSALPPSKLLSGLFTLAAAPGHDGVLRLSPSAVARALLDFHSYIARTHEAARDERHQETLEERIDEIVQAYFAAFYIAAHSATTPQTHGGALQRVAQDSLRAIFILRDHLSPGRHQAVSETIDAQILAATFPPRSTNYYLTPLFSIPRNMVERLSLAVRTFTKPKSEDRARPSEEAALWIFDLLGVASADLKGQSAVGPEGKTKKQKSEARRRVLRIAIELDIWRAELALAMTNANMGAVKARAGIAHGPGIEPSALGLLLNADADEDFKLGLDPEDDEISIPNALSPVKLEPDGVINEISARWEDLTETMLVSLLREARALVEEGHSSVLSDRMERGDWLGHLPEEVPLPTTPKRRDMSLGAETDNEHGDSMFDESASESESDGTAEEGYACPLKSILSLYDRFEEQRLAVWTSLPQFANAHKGRRKEMEVYMRGTDGLAGEAGEELGLALLIEYDRQALIGYGLSYDKLDKWLELASNRNAKKIKRRKAAPPPARGRGGRKAASHRKTASVASLDVPAAGTRTRSKTPATRSVAGSSRGGTPKRGRRPKQ